MNLPVELEEKIRWYYVEHPFAEKIKEWERMRQFNMPAILRRYSEEQPFYKYVLSWYNNSYWDI